MVISVLVPTGVWLIQRYTSIKYIIFPLKCSGVEIGIAVKQTSNLLSCIHGTCVNVVPFHRRPSLGFVSVRCRVKMRLYKVIGTQPCPLLCLAQTARPRWWLAFACRRKLNREVCQSASRLMEHLTQRRSRFELSHTLMTQPEACHHGCYTTQVNTFTQAVPSFFFFWTRETFHQQKMYLITLQKQSWHLSLTQFVSFILFFFPILPHKSTHQPRTRAHTHTHTANNLFLVT